MFFWTSVVLVKGPQALGTLAFAIFKSFRFVFESTGHTKTEKHSEVNQRAHSCFKCSFGLQ